MEVGAVRGDPRSKNPQRKWRRLRWKEVYVANKKQGEVPVQEGRRIRARERRQVPVSRERGQGHVEGLLVSAGNLAAVGPRG